MKNDSQKGVWKRTLHVFTGIRIPFALFVLYFVLGIVDTKIGLLYIPYYSKLQTGVLDDNATVWYYVLFLMLSLLVGLLEAIPLFYAESQLTRNLQKKLYHKILHLPVRDFEQETPSELISRVTSDSEYANSVIVSILGFFSGFATMVMTLSEMSELNTALGYLLIPVGAYILLSAWIDGKVSFLTSQRIRKALSQTTAFFSEHIPALLSIKQLGAESEEQALGKKAIEIQYRADLYEAFMSLISTFVTGSSSNIIAILIFVFGAGAVREGAMSITDLAAFYQMTLIAYGAISSIPDLYTSLMRSNGELFYVGRLMAGKEETYERRQAMPLSDEDIVFKNVRFSYSEDAEDSVLRDVSCTIPHGRRTAVVGLNGSGKTTLLKLVERFYSADSGTICYGSVPAEEIHLGEWRQSFGYVLQKPRLFNASIRENVVYGIEREVSDGEVAAVLKKASAYDFVTALPGGLDFVVGDNGCRLSQGEKQRIAIARAIMIDPAFLLLDEATSNVDVDSRSAVDQALRALMEGRTTVFISHNPEEIKTADHVIVLSGGRVEAEGTVEQAAQNSVTCRKILSGGAI